MPILRDWFRNCHSSKWRVEGEGCNNPNVTNAFMGTNADIRNGNGTKFPTTNTMMALRVFYYQWYRCLGESTSGQCSRLE